MWLLLYMDRFNDTKKFVLLFATAILLCLVVVFLAIRLLFSYDVTDEHDLNTENYDQAGYLVTNDDVLENSLEGYNNQDITKPNDSIWQQEINQYPNSEDDSFEIYSFPEQVDESQFGGVYQKQNTEVSAQGLTETSLPVETTPYKTSSPDQTALSVNETLEVKKWKDCGEIELPTGFGLVTFAYTASKNQAVICVGESVANKCKSTKMNLMSGEDAVSTIILTELSGGECGVGISVQSDQATLCDLEKIMNHNSQERKSLSQWQKVFKAEPGPTFASMYVNNQSAFYSAGASEQFGCNIYNIQ